MPRHRPANARLDAGFVRRRVPKLQRFVGQGVAGVGAAVAKAGNR